MNADSLSETEFKTSLMDSVEGLAVLSNVFVLEVEDHPGFPAAHRTENKLGSAMDCIILFLQVKAAIFVARFVEVVSLMRRGTQRNVVFGYSHKQWQSAD